jgi:hypothetical protein
MEAILEFLMGLGGLLVGGLVLFFLVGLYFVWSRARKLSETT